MLKTYRDPLLQLATTCGSLLHELQIIWDEVGESEADRDKMLSDLEQECLDVYRRKVDYANKLRAQLRQTIADSEAEIAEICSAMGERPVHTRQNFGSLKEELNLILHQLEEMRKRKSDRRNQYLEVIEQVQNLSDEIHGMTEHPTSSAVLDESDLSVRKLEEFNRELQALQKEKSHRQEQIQGHINTLNSLCSVLGFDFLQTVVEVHPSLCDSDFTRSINDATIQWLAAMVQNLRATKLQRMQKLQDLASSMLELWNLMDTPPDEQQAFQNVTCNIAASEDEITMPHILSEDFLNNVEAEVCRLEKLKSSKMKELILKKRSDLEDLCRKAHLVLEKDATTEFTVGAIESGVVDVSYVLEKIEWQTGKVKEEALRRKEILEKVEKWLAACEEERWLDGYNKDENRYNTGKGSHLILKRAEKARALISKIQGWVEVLMSKTLTWEQENETEFIYDGVRLISMFEDYMAMHEEKEQQRRRQRDQKKLQGQQIAEKESSFGSKPSPSKLVSIQKTPKASTTGSSTKNGSLQTPKSASARNTPCSSNGKRELDLTGASLKKHCLSTANPSEVESHTVRKPFSSIPPTTPITRNQSPRTEEDPNIQQLQMESLSKAKALSKNLSFPSPSKTNLLTRPPTSQDWKEVDTYSGTEAEYSPEEIRLGFQLQG